MMDWKNKRNYFCINQALLIYSRKEKKKKKNPKPPKSQIQKDRRNSLPVEFEHFRSLVVLLLEEGVIVRIESSLHPL